MTNKHKRADFEISAYDREIVLAWKPTVVSHKRSGKNEVSELTCDVPNCNRTAVVVWGVFGWPLKENGKTTSDRAKMHYHRLCYRHYKRNSNKGDEFNIAEAFKIKPAIIGVNVDRFGIPLPRDYHEVMGLIKRRKEREKLEKKEKSLKRLANWKASGGVKTKPRPRPEPILESDLDDIINEIVGE